MNQLLGKIGRMILLISVMTGIFFSCGEGIQLLPFPVLTVNTEKYSNSVYQEKISPYSFSVHNVGGNFTFLKNKLSKIKDLFCHSFIKDFWQPTKNRFSSLAVFSVFQTFLKTTKFLPDVSDRAPPLK
jgi:hypothetical protein